MNEGNFDRFIETGEGLIVYRLENMQCKTCRFATKDTSSCLKYRTKPFAVLDGEPVCPRFQPREEGPGAGELGRNTL